MKKNLSQSKSPKLLMVLNDMAWFWSHRLPLAKAILGEGWDLTLAVYEAEEDKKLNELGVVARNLPKLGRSLNPFPQIMLMICLAQIIKRDKPHIIHAVTIRYAFYVGLVARLIGYDPVVFTVAGLGSLYTAPGLKMKLLRWIAIPLLRFAFGGKDKFIIFQNPDDQFAMLRTKITTKENSTVIRGSGVDINEFSFQPYQKNNVNEKGEIVLFASRLLREKGITDFIKAGEILNQRKVKARLVVAGNVYPDNARSLTHAEMDAAHNSGAIEWIGQHDDMSDLIARSKMMVLPSYYGEGVPKVLLEAAAIGRPIITCDAPGCRETVDNGVNGYLTSPQNPEELADAIEDLIKDTGKCLEFGRASRQRVERDFHTGHVIEKTMDVYRRLL